MKSKFALLAVCLLSTAAAMTTEINPVSATELGRRINATPVAYRYGYGSRYYAPRRYGAYYGGYYGARPYYYRGYYGPRRYYSGYYRGPRYGYGYGYAPRYGWYGGRAWY